MHVEGEDTYTPRQSNSPFVERPPNNVFEIDTLGEASIPSKLDSVHWVDDANVLLYNPFVDLKSDRTFFGLSSGAAGASQPVQQHYLQRAGPRKLLFHEPSNLIAGIVVGGGISPAINNVIRALVNALHYRYKVKKVLGFRYGYQGLTPNTKFGPIELNPEVTRDIHHFGGSFLGTSRGPQDIEVMVDTLVKLNVGLLFTVGGDGTGKAAYKICREIKNRDLKIGVIQLPKTVDNDLGFVSRTFGFETAVEMAQDPIRAAHEEARSAENGIGIVKLMGRDSGFIALWAALASSDVNVLLIPEQKFKIEKVLQHLEDRLKTRDHCVIVISEGAGQENFEINGATDASGNAKMGDVGRWLADKVTSHFKSRSIPCTVKYIDPSYTIRSAKANALDSVFAVQLAHAAAHAGLSGKTNCMVGLVHGEFIHIPIAKAIEARKKVDVTGSLYQSILDNTGMPAQFW